jgi:hypothetical protein
MKVSFLHQLSWQSWYPWCTFGMMVLCCTPSIDNGNGIIGVTAIAPLEWTYLKGPTPITTRFKSLGPVGVEVI